MKHTGKIIIRGVGTNQYNGKNDKFFQSENIYIS